MKPIAADWNKASSTLAPTVCIVLALVVVLLLGGWGVYQDGERHSLAVLQSAVMNARSGAERTAGRVEQELLDLGTDGTLSEASNWLREHWKRVAPRPDRLYGVVVDTDGKIIAHSNASLVGEMLCPASQFEPIQGVGPNVFRTSCPTLSDQQSIEVVVPIDPGGLERGTYHSGISWNLLQEQIRSSRGRSLMAWGIIIGCILLVVLFSSISLYRITHRAVALEHALAMSNARRIGEMSQLIIGLAHEIRNPLNAVRLNLFTAERVFRREAELSAEETTAMLSESVREVVRIDELITLLLGYARPEQSKPQRVNVGNEIDAVLQFLRPGLQVAEICVNFNAPAEPVFIEAGRGHLRQILLNLLTNARDAVSQHSGRIDLGLTEQDGVITLKISDNGSGIPPQALPRIFEPFFTTKEDGVGLGLAIVRSLVELGGGTIEYLPGASGSSFKIQWPVAPHRNNVE